MTAADLLAQHARLWHAATHHPFLDGVREGRLPAAAFDRWLSQDYLYVLGLLRAQARILANAPAADFGVLVGGVSALVDELAWFEQKAAARRVDLRVLPHPTCRAYTDFLHAVTFGPYAAQITVIWVVERAYLEAWTGARPGHGAMREFVEHWTTPGFGAYVAHLEAAADRALAEAPQPDGDAAADAFRWVARYEAGFWQIAFDVS